MLEASRAPRLRGVIPPVLTPFQANRSVDYKAWERLIEWLVEHKVDGLFVAGGSGEWTQLTEQERVELTRRAAAVAAGEVPVIAGSLGRDFEETLRLCDAMADAGADYLGVVIPRFVQPETRTVFSSADGEADYEDVLTSGFLERIEDAICAFFDRMLRRIPFPTMLYDPPSSGEFALQPQWLKRLAQMEFVVGLKKTTRDLRLLTQLIEAAGEGFAMLAGDETVMLPCLAVGAVGCVGGGASVFPELLRDVFDAFARGDWQTARDAHFALEHANRLLELGRWPLTGKIALAARGLPIEPVTRVEAWPPTPQDRARIEAFFQQPRFAG